MAMSSWVFSMLQPSLLSSFPHYCCRPAFASISRRFSPALEAADAGSEEGGTAPQAAPAELRAADDPDTQLILQLFPDHVAAAILAKLTEAEEEAAVPATFASLNVQEGQASSDVEDGSGTAGGGSGGSSSSSAYGGTQLVEVIVDRGRPVRVRLSSRRDLQLDVQFSVEVSGPTGWLVGGLGGEMTGLHSMPG